MGVVTGAGAAWGGWLGGSHRRRSSRRGRRRGLVAYPLLNLFDGGIITDIGAIVATLHREVEDGRTGRVEGFAIGGIGHEDIEIIVVVALGPTACVVVDKESVVQIGIDVVAGHQGTVAAVDDLGVVARHITVEGNLAGEAHAAALHAAHGKIEVDLHASLTVQDDIVLYPGTGNLGIAPGRSAGAHGHKQGDHEQHASADGKG